MTEQPTVTSKPAPQKTPFLRFSGAKRDGLLCPRWLNYQLLDVQSEERSDSETGGGERPLGIPTLRDRVAPPNKSAQAAIQEVHKLLPAGYKDVVDADGSKYFAIQAPCLWGVTPHVLGLNY
jgi:hypothetical protein